MSARAVIALAVLAACAEPKRTSPLEGFAVQVSTVEWRAVGETEDAAKVDIALVVDGQKTALGALDGTVETCAIARAEATATELVCGRNQHFAAEIVEHELVVNDGRHEIKRIPIGPSVAISVAPLALPVAN